jgi:hypothetical protein
MSWAVLLEFWVWRDRFGRSELRRLYDEVLPPHLVVSKMADRFEDFEVERLREPIGYFSTVLGESTRDLAFSEALERLGNSETWYFSYQTYANEPGFRAWLDISLEIDPCIPVPSLRRVQFVISSRSIFWDWFGEADWEENGGLRREIVWPRWARGLAQITPIVFAREAYENIYEELDIEGLLRDGPRERSEFMVIGRELVDRLGRDRLLAGTISFGEELADGSVMLSLFNLPAGAIYTQIAAMLGLPPQSMGV